MIDWGSLADWVGAVGGLLAVFAAAVAWRSSERMLDLERKRDARRLDAEKLGQARLVFAVGAQLPNRDGVEKWAIYLYNGSLKPIYDVCIESQRLDENNSNPPLELGAVPPGRFVIPSHLKYHWGALVDLSLCPEDVQLLVKGKGAKMITRVTFTDAARHRWELVDGRQLVENPEM